MHKRIYGNDAPTAALTSLIWGCGTFWEQARTSAKCQEHSMNGYVCYASVQSINQSTKHFIIYYLSTFIAPNLVKVWALSALRSHSHKHLPFEGLLYAVDFPAPLWLAAAYSWRCLANVEPASACPSSSGTFQHSDDTRTTFLPAKQPSTIFIVSHGETICGLSWAPFAVEDWIQYVSPTL
jgi:hypothetical protein